MKEEKIENKYEYMTKKMMQTRLSINTQRKQNQYEQINH